MTDRASSNAEEIRDEIHTGNIVTRDDLIEQVEQYEVTYISAAKEYLEESDNPDAYFDMVGELTIKDSLSNLPWEALASAALQQDIFDELRRMEIDPNEENPDKWCAYKCSECEEYKDRYMNFLEDDAKLVCDECMADRRPQEGDITTEDHRRFYCDGKLIIELNEEESHECEKYVREWMNQNGYFPAVYWISDHGNAHHLSIPDELPQRTVTENNEGGS